MGWFTNTIDTIKEAGRTEPVECPRGWGQVLFQRQMDGFPPFCTLASRCPIGGVGSCTKCKHPYNPANIDVLRQALHDLDQLRKQGLVTEAEFNVRRQMIVFAQDYARPPGQGFVTASWTLGPLGLVIGSVGVFLTMHIHVAFIPIAMVGAVLLGLSLSFAALGRIRRRAADTAMSQRNASEW